MERAKKMVLISTENLERMRQQQQHQQQQPTSAAQESMKNTTPRNSENDDSENTVRTPGTPLTRLDAEMSRILNSTWPRSEDEKWKMYREVLWRYLHFIRVTRKRNAMRYAGETEIEDNDTSPVDKDETTYDDVFLDLAQKSQTPSKLPHSSGIDIAKNTERKEHSKQVMESVKKIVETVPKTYRAQARLLMRHLLDKAVPDRISWNEEGVVTIDGSIVKDSNIADLINDAMRERKTVKAAGRIQFARLLRSLKTRSALVGNKELLKIFASSIIEKTQTFACSTPKISKVQTLSYVQKRGKRTRGKGEREEEGRSDDCTLFLSPHFKAYPPTTFMKNADSPPTRKRRLLDWSTLKKR